MTDDGLCGDCMEGKCHGGEPDDCGCARHDASVEGAQEHCNGGNDRECEACIGGWCGYQDGHCYPGSCDDREDNAGCEHCGCCACTSCEYARVA